MDDFIRPPQPNQNKPEKPKKQIKDTIFIVVMIVCIVVGFVSGYLVQRNPITSPASGDEIIDEAYDIISEKWYNPNDDEEVDIQGNTISALMASLNDRHSGYLSFDQSLQSRDTTNGDYEGVGVTFLKINIGILITDVYENTPASEANLQVGDYITSVNGTNIADMENADIISMIQDSSSPTVTLAGIRNGQAFSQEVTHRAYERNVTGEIREDNGKKFGYIDINTFGENTAEEIEALLKEFVANQVDTLVLDLRDNGGGFVTTAIDVLSLFNEEGKEIFQMQQKDQAVEHITAKSSDRYNFAQNYILVNGKSASAAEVVSGSLQENNGFKLIGNQTFGKGTAQTSASLSDGSVIRYTYARWYLPSGKWINGEGLTPDYEADRISIPAGANTVLENDLQVDNVSVSVIYMQAMLKTLGYNVDREDGYFSVGTSDALRQFETDNGLPVDGVYSNDDQNMLLSKLAIRVNDRNYDDQYQRLLELI